jgi:cystathionine gamma-synthase
VDSTFATPCNSRALTFGADLVIHSATKYLAGHNDVLAGAIAGRQDLVDAVRSMHNILGGVIDPHAAYLLLRGMKTLDLRVERQNATAMEIARRLEAHPKICTVHYPGLPSHRDHAIAAKQMSGFGGVISFEVKGDLWKTAALIDAVKLPYIAPSLGGVESLIEQPTVISYWDQGPEKRAEYGIKDNLVRYSCGVECVEDLWADLEQALASI